MNIKQMPLTYRALDFLLYPIMFLIAGFNKNDVQHTHGYNTQNFFDVDLPNTGVVKTTGQDNSKFKNTGGFISHWGLFHIPFLGGWRNYIVLENVNFKKPWFIGWKKDGFAQVSRLPINSNRVRVLTGRYGEETQFFGICGSGNFVNIKEVAKGILGDNKFSEAPLY